MKKILFLSLLFIPLLAYNKETILNITPLNVHLYVVDSTGNDLLNKETTHNILGNRITVIYENKIYVRDSLIPETKYYMPTFHGLQTKRDNIVRRYMLTFGEFDIGKNANKEFTIDWGDGTKDKINFYHRFKIRNGKPRITTKYFLNGTVINNNITIIKS